MMKGYLRVAVRAMARQKGYTLINVMGLTIGMVSCLLIFQYVASELSFDRFYPAADRIYRVDQITLARDREPERSAQTGFAMAPSLERTLPGLDQVVRVHPDYMGAIVSNPAQPENSFEEKEAVYADPSFLDMFAIRLIAGNRDRALAEPGTILISESTARRYFGNKDPIGKTIRYIGWVRGERRVAGVFEDAPPRTHLRYAMLLPLEDLLRSDDYRQADVAWQLQNFTTYVRLNAGVDPATVQNRASVVLEQNYPSPPSQKEAVRLTPLREVHFDTEAAGSLMVVSNRRTVYFFGIVGMLTLLIALVNYINLATARALERAREVGIRKVIGADRRHLVVQFLSEAALTNGLALVLSIAITPLMLPIVNRVVGYTLEYSFFINPGFWLTLAVGYVFSVVLAGLYPAVVLSSFEPLTVLKGTNGPHNIQLWLRRGLVVFQFTASVVLIVGTSIVYSQLGYLQRMDLGLELDRVLAINGPRVLDKGLNTPEATRVFKAELEKLPAVRQIASSATLPGEGYIWYTRDMRRKADAPEDVIEGRLTLIDSAFVSLYGMKVIGGRLSEPTLNDSGAERLAIVTRTTMHNLGIASAEDAIGQVIYVGGPEGRIVAVVDDFEWSSAHSSKENVVFFLRPALNTLSIRLDTQDLPGTLAAIEAVYKRLFPGNPLKYRFVEESFDAQYVRDRQFASLFTLFAGLAIFIACLGLFGLAAFSVRQRTKEIGIRKVLGASTPRLVALLSASFLKLVLVAIVIASPLAYILMKQWLEGFTYRVAIGPGIFGLAAAIAVITALLTVSFQSVRAAVANPVRSIRRE